MSNCAPCDGRESTASITEAHTGSFEAVYSDWIYNGAIITLRCPQVRPWGHKPVVKVRSVLNYTFVYP